MREHTFKFIDLFNMENQISDLGKLYKNWKVKSSRMEFIVRGPGGWG